MGLDITAYSHLKHVGRHEKDPTLNEGEPGGLDDWCYYENHVDAYAYDTFPASYRGLPILWTAKGLVHSGCYETTEQTETHGFRAGSYGGYNRWRESLAKQFNPQSKAPGERYWGEPDPKKPFYELIWFADNEGSIGPDAAKDLLADFREHADVWVPCFEDWDTYKDWTRAFELAAAGGLVKFH
jgi:hypothetical protein